MNLTILTAGQKTVAFVGMVLYMALVVAVGLIYSKRNKSTEDFFLGGRSLGPWVTAMSAEASDMSSWLLMGLPGLAYLTGFASAGWTAIGLAVGTWFNWRFVAYRLRTYSHVAGNAITLPDYFSNRFHDTRRIIMTLSAVIIFFFFIIYTSSGFAALGKLFNSLFGFDYTLMMVIGTIVVVIYTIVGGFLAESTTDFMQGTLMFFSLIIILVAGVLEAGGLGAVAASIESLDGFGSLFASHDRATGTRSAVSFLEIASSMAWGLGYFGMPHVLLRFMAIRNAGELTRSRRIAMVWVLVSLAAAVCIGVVGVAAVPSLLDGATVGELSSRSETIFIVMTQLLANYSGILVVLVGVILSGILAATMSTSDSQLLVTASAVSQNFFKGVLKKDATDKQILWVSRITIILVAIIGAMLAADPNSSIFGIVSYAWAGFGAAFGPLMLFSLFWKRTTLVGTIAGMAGGFAAVVVWKYLIAPLGGAWSIYELLPAFLFSALCIVVASLLSPQPSQEIVEEFEHIAAGKAK
ncbi:MAG: sodium/proline symporter PutP [Sphaerochaetaceae bacterium]